MIQTLTGLGTTATQWYRRSDDNTIESSRALRLSLSSFPALPSLTVWSWQAFDLHEPWFPLLQNQNYLLSSQACCGESEMMWVLVHTVGAQKTLVLFLFPSLKLTCWNNPKGKSHQYLWKIKSISINSWTLLSESWCLGLSELSAVQACAV